MKTTVNFDEEKATVWNIASQCPFVGGNAVLEARNILMNFSDSINWDDKETCEEAGYYKQMQQLTKSELLAYAVPNPAKNSILIFYPFEKDIDYRVEVYDIIGKKVNNTGQLRNLSVVEMNTSQLQNGSYHFIILNDKSIKVANGKFIVIK